MTACFFWNEGNAPWTLDRPMTPVYNGFSHKEVLQMRGVFGLLGLVVTLLIGQFIYRSYVTSPEGGTTAGALIQTANIAGVKNDLLAMANAERTYMALNGRYAPLEDLFANGDLQIDPSREREGYLYVAHVSDSAFVITAVYNGPASGMPNLSINNAMQISQE